MNSSNLLEEFLCNQDLLSDDEILKFLSEEEDDGRPNSEYLTALREKHQNDSCDEHSLLRQAYVLYEMCLDVR